MNEEQIRQIVRDEMQKSQYNVSSTSIHFHDGINSPNLPASSITSFVALPANNPLGVASPNVLNPSGPPTQSQLINNRATTNAPQPPQIYVVPVPIIYGYGVGSYSAFNGGDAPVGTLICFSNAGTTAELFIKVQTGENPDTFIWRGVDLPLTA